MKPVILVGAESIGKVALEVVNSVNNVVYCFLDDMHNEENAQQEVNHVSIMGKAEDEDMLRLVGNTCDYFVSIESPHDRKRTIKAIYKLIKTYPTTLTHKTAHVADDAELSWGNLLGMGAMVGANVQVGNSCLILANAAIDYDTKIGNFCHIGLNATIGANVTIEDEVFVGNGVTIIAGVKIGKGARIGAGSVVMADVAAGKTMLGNPAKEYN